MTHLHNNKSTLAMLGLAAAAALLYGRAAQAQEAGSSSVQLYGTVDAAVTSASTGGAAGARNMPCQFEIRPSAMHRAHDQRMASSCAIAASTAPFLHLKHRAAMTPVRSKSVAWAITLA